MRTLTNEKMAEAFGGQIPSVTDEDLELALDTLPGYVFYKNTKSGRSFECSRCQGKITLEFPLRTDTCIERDAMAVSHNEAGLCPMCRREVIFKQDGRTKNARSLFLNSHFVYVYPQSNGTVVLICEELIMRYSKGTRTARNRYIDEIFILRLDDPVFYYFNFYSKNWRELREGDTNDIEPFSHGTSFPVHDPYKVIGLDRLEDTFLKYSQYTKYVHSLCKYLFRYCTHPQYEMLTKMGLRNIVYESFEKGNDNKRHFDWTKTGKDFFKTLTKAEISELRRREYYGLDAMKVRERYKKICKMSLSEAELVYRAGDRDSHKYLLRYRYDPRRFCRYIEKQQKLYERLYEENGCCHAAYYYRRSAAEEWKDYIRLAIENGYDLTQEVVFFPKNLAKAHDEVTETFNRLQAERKARDLEAANVEALKRLEERRERYEWQSGDYFIKVPESLAQIIREGQRQQHCVAGYCQRHADGALTILFMRRVSDPDTNFITIEMSRDDVIVQARMFRNGAPDEDAQAFINRYKKIIEMRKKKRGNKNSSCDTQRGSGASA